MRHVRAFGDAALLTATAGAAEARTLAASLRQSLEDPDLGRCVLDVVPGLDSVVVTLDPTQAATFGGAGGPADGLGAAMDELGRRLAEAEARPEAALSGADHELPVVFDGPDRDLVAEAAGCDVDGLVDLVTGAELRVELVGFSPGFAYLGGLPEPLAAIGRRESPRPAVPAGSLAVAGGFAAFYPQATPGGWQLLGRTDVALFNAALAPHARLWPGDRVRLVRAPPAATGDGLRKDLVDWDRPALSVPFGQREAFVVLRPGPATTVQDGGRVGLAALGVPRAGPADPVAHDLANRLVGNHPRAAALEACLEGPELCAMAATHVAVTGDVAVSVDDRPVRTGTVIPLARLQRLTIGHVRRGARAYLAVAGGLVGQPLLGSLASDSLSGLGPGRLRHGDRLGLGPARPGALGDHLTWPPPRADPFDGGGLDDTVLRVLPGPHPDWFDPGVLARLADTVFEVSPVSDRIGVRLSPAPSERLIASLTTGAPAPLLARRPGRLAPLGMVTGAVQVPPGGDPVVLGPDHATLGGYPVVAVVIAADLRHLGQCRPGDLVRFQPVAAAGARAAWADLQRHLATAVAGRYPTSAG